MPMQTSRQGCHTAQCQRCRAHFCQCVLRKAREEGNKFQSQIQAATDADADKQAKMPQGAVPEVQGSFLSVCPSQGK